MSAILVALYDSHATAERVRTELVRDGFPTDRVALTSRKEPGAAASVPAESSSEQLREYFKSLFNEEKELRRVSMLVARVREGAATVTVHPRGEREIGRARQILGHGRPLALESEHLEDTALEQAASPHERTYLERVLSATRPD